MNAFSSYFCREYNTLRNLTFVFFILIAFGASAQLFDTTVYHSDLSTFVRAMDTENLDFKENQEDTSLHFGHRLNPFTQENQLRLHTGRIASPSMSIAPKLPQAGSFQYANELFSPWFQVTDSTKFYHSNTPRTFLQYSQGTGKLLYFVAEHSQKIASNWSFGLNYSRIKSHNLYYNNLPKYNEERITNLFTANVYSHFHTINRKYEVFVNFINNNNTVKETQGVSNPFNFDLYTGRAKTYSGIANLPDAQNQMRTRELVVQQYFRPGSRQIQVDDTTTIADTTTKNIKSQCFHKLSISRQIIQFTDNDPNLNLYPERLLSLVTNDSNYFSRISNTLGRSFVVGKSTLKYYLNHEWLYVNQLSLHQSKLNNLRIGSMWSGVLGKLRSSFQGDYCVAGFNQSDFLVAYNIRTQYEKFNYHIDLNYIKQRPNYTDQFFVSNYAYWNQRLGQTTWTNARLKVSYLEDKLIIGGQFRPIQSMVYYDTSGRPSQMDQTVNYANAFVEWKLEWKQFHWDQTGQYQYSSSTNLPVPEFASRSRIYKEGHLFNKNMFARFGVDITYFSTFTAPSYNPTIRQFALSNKVTGGYPVFDIFFHAKVKTMELFASTHHMSQGYFIGDSYSDYTYPLIGRTFQFGVNWRLFD